MTNPEYTSTNPVITKYTAHIQKKPALHGFSLMAGMRVFINAAPAKQSSFSAPLSIL
jgi:hypothetical protein